MSGLFIANVWILNGDLVLQGEVSKVHCIALWITFISSLDKILQGTKLCSSGFVACHTYIWLHIDEPIFAPGKIYQVTRMPWASRNCHKVALQTKSDTYLYDLSIRRWYSELSVSGSKCHFQKLLLIAKSLKLYYKIIHPASSQEWKT